MASPAVKATQHKVRVFSTGQQSGQTRSPSVFALALDTLHQNLSKATWVDVVAAYYDLPFLQDTVRRARQSKLRTVRIVVGGLTGRRRGEQINELRALMNSHRGGTNVEVRLADADGIFHTKVFVFGKSNGSSAWVGSVNATTAAFTANEELLLQLDHAPTALRDYVASVWEAATPVTISEYSISSLLAFFRSGLLYFKPHEHLTYSFNPFDDLTKRLSSEELEALGASSLPYAEPGDQLTAFSVKVALRQAIDRDPEIGSWDDDEDSNSEAQKRRRLAFKPYYVESSLGYWVPGALHDEVEAKLDEVAAQKRSRLLELRSDLDTVGRSRLEYYYEEYVRSGIVLLERAGIDWRLYTDSDRTEDPIRSPLDRRAELSRRLDRLFSILHNSKGLDRLCRPFIGGKMPEIWGDTVASEEFSDTFFGYLSWITMQGTKPRVPRTILRALGYERQAADADELRNALQEILRSEGWSDERWINAR